MTNVLLFIAGFFWGLLFCLFNYYWTKRALNGSGGRRAQMIFIFRLLICAAAMFAVADYVAALLGTALGLVSVKNYILIKTLKDMYIQRGKG